ncbi:MAG: alanyl-tRNA editing protein AlaXM [Candidatus Woesearchaeota archaeon]
MSEAIYLKDSYLKEFEATVVAVKDDKYVVLDRTAFYPNSGGQPHDTGVLMKEGEEYPVVYAAKFASDISHEVSRPGLKMGDKVTGRIDWPRRYVLMRHHTAAHIVSQVIRSRTGARVTGNQLDLDKARIDFDLENFNKDDLKSYEKEANEIIAKELPVKKYFLPREVALQKPELFSLKNVLPPDVQELRIVEIPGFDTSACGGCHLDNTREIGQVEITKSENKGKFNRRIVFVINNQDKSCQ